MTNTSQQARPADPSFSVGTTAGRGPALSRLPSSAPLKWRVLEAYCLAGDPLRPRDVAARFAPVQTRPFRNAAEYRAWRAGKRAALDARSRVSQAVRRLAYEGLLMPTSEPRLAPGFRERFRRDGWPAVEPIRYTTDEHGNLSRRRGATTPRERYALAIVSVLADNPDGVPYSMLLEMTGGATEAGGESRSWRLGYRDMVAEGVVLDGAARGPTIAGRERYRALLRRFCGGAQ